jgi:glucokinase
MTNKPAILLADIGGTHIRFALYDFKKMTDVTVYYQRDFKNFFDAIASYLKKMNITTVSEMLFAVAGNVQEGSVRLTNYDLVLKESVLIKKYCLKKCTIVNDFEANAYGVLALKSKQIKKIGRGRPEKNHPICILGPGTGLGVCFLVKEVNGWRAYPSEAGHSAIPHMFSKEGSYNEIYDFLKKKFSYVSIERVLSGDGLVNMYQALAQNKKFKSLTPKDIHQRANDGEQLARQAFDCFFHFLGAFAGNMALTLKTTGGIYLAGGILLRENVLDWMEKSDFRAAFENKGRFETFNERIPTSVVLDAHLPFAGLKYMAQSKIN